MRIRISRKDYLVKSTVTRSGVRARSSRNMMNNGMYVITAGLVNVYTKQETEAKIQEMIGEIGGYEHNQIVASDNWNILHNLGYKPNIQIEDSSGDSVIPYKITHNSVNNTLVLFSGAMSGKAYCS